MSSKHNTQKKKGEERKEQGWKSHKGQARGGGKKEKKPRMAVPPPGSGSSMSPRVAKRAASQGRSS